MEPSYRKFSLRVSIIYDSIILANIGLSVYFLFFNQFRSVSQGIWFVFLIQSVSLPLLAIINFITSQKETNRITNYLEQEQIIKEKSALFHELGENQGESYQLKYSNITTLMNLLIFMTLFIDIVITLNFVWVGRFVDSLSRGRTQTGDLYYYVAIINQAYFITIIGGALLVNSILIPKDRIGKLLYGVEAPNLEQKKSILTQFKKIGKSRKYALFGIIVLMLISLSSIAYTFTVLDDNDDIINIPEDTDLVRYEPYLLRLSDNNRIQFLASSAWLNQNDLVFPQLTLVEINLENQRTFAINLLDLLGGRQLILDIVMYENNVYMLDFVNIPGDLGYNYSIYHFDLETKTTEMIFSSHLEVNFQQFNKYWSRLVYNLVAFENGVHLFQTDYIPVSDPAHTTTNVTTVTLDGEIKVQPISNITLIDGITHNGKTYLLHHDQSSNFQYFALSETDTTGINLDVSQIATQTLIAEYNEETGGFVPNGATLLELEGELFYRSQFNFYSIDREISSKDITSYRNSLRGFFGKTMKGMVKVDDLIMIQTEQGIGYYDYETLNLIIEGKAEQSGYVSSFNANIVYTSGKIYSANSDGRLFVWSDNPNTIENHQNQVDITLKLAVVFYTVMAISLVYLKQKWLPI